MTRRQIRIISYCLVIGLAVFLTVAMQGCAAKSVPASTHSATLSSIAIKPSSGNVGVDATEQFTAMGTYSNGSTADITSQVKWDSVDETAASISSAGVVTGVSPGSTSISASLSGIHSPAANVLVVP